jgi:hypothetical protein
VGYKHHYQMETRFRLDINSKLTLEHYASRLHEKYPKYSKKQLYLFIRSPFDYFKLVSRTLDNNSEDTIFIFGEYLKIKLNAVTRRFYEYRKLKYKLLKRLSNEQHTD